MNHVKTITYFTKSSQSYIDDDLCSCGIGLELYRGLIFSFLIKLILSIGNKESPPLPQKR